MSSPLIKSPLEMLYEQAGIPHMQAGGQPPPNASQLGQTALGDGLMDMTPPNPINVYRADPTGRFGGKDRMETMPTRLDKTTIQDYIKAMRAGESLGIPQLTPDQLARMLLVEGRGDFGFNALNENNKVAMQKAAMLNEMGHSPVASNFAAAIYDKQQLADRIQKPFQEVWNGTGRSGTTGRTGAQHNDRYNQFGYAVEHPKNAELMSVLNSAYNYKPAPKLNLDAPMMQQNTLGTEFAAGGSTTPFYDMSKLLIQKHLSGN